MTPLNVTLKDNNDGTATLSWQNPGNKGVNDSYVNEDKLSYNIYQGATTSEKEAKLITTTKDNSYKINIPRKGTQSLAYYGVSAISSTGESNAGVSSPIVTGSPYTVPFCESFNNNRFDNNMWWMAALGEHSFEFITAPDGDGTCIHFYARNAGEKALISSGKIDLGGTINPTLKFKIYGKKTDASQDNTLKVIIDKAGTSETDTIKTIKFSEQDNQVWQLVDVPLADYIDLPYIAIRFLATGNTPYALMDIDDMKIIDLPLYDLSVTAKAPQTTIKGKKASVNITVENTGERTASDFDITLSTADGNTVSRQKIDKLEPMHTTNVVLSYMSKAIDPEKLELIAGVDYSKDLDESNNNETVHIRLIKSTLPKASNLTVSSDGNKLTWNAPTDEQTRVTEDFEDYTSWTTDNFGEWITYDGDHGIETTLGNPDNGKATPINRTAHAWAIYDPLDYDLDYDKYPNYQPHSGNKFVAAHSSSNTWELPLGHNDDWLISPELSGKAQTISFYVGKYLDDYFLKENYEILYSTTDQTPDSFTLLASETVKQGAWYKVEYQLPEGAKFFAIRYVAEKQFNMFVDDITYNAVLPEIEGYNIYANGKLIDTVPATETSYTLPVEHDTGKYNVTVSYKVGESAFSNDASVVTDIKRISISKWNDVVIYTIDGRKVAEGKDMLKRLPRGNYIVRDKATGKTINVVK